MYTALPQTESYSNKEMGQRDRYSGATVARAFKWKIDRVEIDCSG